VIAAPPRTGLAAAIAVVAALIGALLTMIGILAILGGGAECSAPEPTPTQQARNAIPESALAVYRQAGQRYNLDWAFLASIGAQECNHGRCAGAAQINASGCGGPMQIAMRRRSPCSPGDGPTLWDRYRQDGDGDGRRDPFDFADSVNTAAIILRRAKGAPPIGGSAAAYRRAACAYYGACADAAVAYADEVMARAVSYGFQGGRATPSNAAAGLVVGDASACGGPGFDGFAGTKLRFAPGVDARITPLMRRVGAAIVAVYGKPLAVTSARRPGAITVDGNVSDHASGNALDFGMAANGGPDDGPIGDQIATAALVVAGWTVARAAEWARHGGLVDIHAAGVRIQVIWKTDQGGNHHNHVHVGVKPDA
jgi:hypothetical protein